MLSLRWWMLYVSTNTITSFQLCRITCLYCFLHSQCFSLCSCCLFYYLCYVTYLGRDWHLPMSYFTVKRLTWFYNLVAFCNLCVQKNVIIVIFNISIENDYMSPNLIIYILKYKTGSGGECVDRRNDCSIFSSNCSAASYFVIIRCPKTCGLCPENGVNKGNSIIIVAMQSCDWVLVEIEENFCIIFHISLLMHQLLHTII